MRKAKTKKTETLVEGYSGEEFEQTGVVSRKAGPPNEARAENAMLAFNDLATGGSSDKVYHVNLDVTSTGLWSVIAQYGRRGGALAMDNKTKGGLLDYDAAKKLFERIIREKVAKGYVRLALSPSQVAAAPVMPPSEPDFVGHFQRPQELLTEIDSVQAAKLVLSDAYYMQDKSDGHSRGVVKIGGTIFGLNKLGRRVPISQALFDELAQIPLATFQIDAELVGEKLVCRDLLHADGDLHALPYEKRFEKLVATILAAGPLALVSIVETWTGAENKGAALARQLDLKREGVVFKLRSASHRGGRNGQHKKFKFVKTLSAIAGEPRGTGKDSVEIYLWNTDALLKADVKPIRVGTVSLIGKPKVKRGDILEVRYLYAFPSRKLCQARFERIRTDVQNIECTTAQLQFKAEEI
jgi:bifunctional non-homologous end joining protein LigD